MEIWFKQFESNGRQILVKKAYDEEGSKFGVQFCWQEKHFDVDFGLWLEDDDNDYHDDFESMIKSQDELFQSINQELVDSVVSDLIKKLNLNK